jgi:hypothetical protein
MVAAQAGSSVSVMRCLGWLLAKDENSRPRFPELSVRPAPREQRPVVRRYSQSLRYLCINALALSAWCQLVVVGDVERERAKAGEIDFFWEEIKH